ncbi:hypothetical protein KDA_07720 [Dictyobacter alpinus]|uniref:Uncharacterized protein n=1 Tax=Dictyobacter alpinus TaxID=2014873 RepID=A0A402B1T6_9CHLR|nr:hypothetical protein [Dictyobacter alpinus]GCE25288.1 hypothetical protein KDA_07720 [Dictyobacter alpinus]
MIDNRVAFSVFAHEFRNKNGYDSHALPCAMNNLYAAGFTHAEHPTFVAVGTTVPISWGRPPDIS